MGDGAMSDDEIAELIRLLKRFAEHDLDQFELWRFSSSWGEVYLSLTRELDPAVSSDDWNDLDAWLERHRDGSNP